ncbi:MAG: CapA family protein [Acidimicrobiales bacterium]
MRWSGRSCLGAVTVLVVVLGVGGLGSANRGSVEVAVSPEASVSSDTVVSPKTPVATVPPATTEPDSIDEGTSTSAEASAGSVTSSALSGPHGPQGPQRSVSLAFGGDVHFEGFLRQSLLEDSGSLLDPIASMLASADLAVVNLETAVTEQGTPDPKQYTFRAPDEAIAALKAAGVDVVSLANNHGRDFGEVGLLDTLDAIDQGGLTVIGAGVNEAEAYGPHVVEIAGRTIAFIGATQVLDAYAIDTWVAGPSSPGLASAKENGLERLIAAVEEASVSVDTTVVFLHWGQEKSTCPSADQQTLADRLSAAGADLVVGGHAHRVQAGGRLNEQTVVNYGLGNFVFYTSDGPGTDSGVFEVTIDVDGRLDYRWIPAVLRNGVATPLEGNQMAAATDQWDGLRDCTNLTP